MNLVSEKLGRRKGKLTKSLRKLYKHLAGAVVVFGISLFFLIFSCTQKLPTSPENKATIFNSLQSIPSVPNGGTPAVIKFNPWKMDSVPIALGMPIIRMVGYNGDTVAFPIGIRDTAYLIIPRGAVKPNTNVTLTLKSDVKRTTDSTMLVALYHFLPQGQVFEKECYLVEPARFQDGTELELSYFNPSSGQWVRENVSTVSNRRVIFKIKHFSDYGAPLEALSSGGQQMEGGVN